MWPEGRRRLRRGVRGVIHRAAAAALAACGMLAAPSVARAQDSSLLEKCPAAGQGARLCLLAAQAVEIAEPRIGLAFSGGNPVEGTASTLGMRMGTFPHISVDARVTGAHFTLPPLRGGGDIGVFAPFFDVDASVGIFDGLRLLPTVGGFGSVDALASLGAARLPGDFANGSPVGYGLGVRLGLLRESFTMPGISVSGMYRHVGDVRFGEVPVDSASFTLNGVSDLSVRAAVSKRLLVLGATAGLGWDRYRSDVSTTVLGSSELPGGVPGANQASVSGYPASRMSAFANLSWTMLILHAVGEVGWQRGTEPAALPTPTGKEDLVRKGSLFASLALRLSI